MPSEPLPAPEPEHHAEDDHVYPSEENYVLPAEEVVVEEEAAKFAGDEPDLPPRYSMVMMESGL